MTLTKSTAKLTIFFDMCNKDLFFRDFGSGKTIIILHGIMGCSDYWIPTAKRLDNTYRVIIPDLPNHGNSFHTNTLDYQSIAYHIEHFIDLHHIEQPIIIGHSWGGKIALNLAKKNNNNIEKIVVIDITSEAQPDENIKKMIEIINQPLPVLKTLKQAHAHFCTMGIEPSVATMLTKGLKIQQQQLSWKWNTSLLCTHYHQVLQPIKLQSHCSTPLLVIKGEKSNYVTPLGIKELQDTFDHLKLVSITNAGHWVHTDNFEDLITTIISFLQQ